MSPLPGTKAVSALGWDLLLVEVGGVGGRLQSAVRAQVPRNRSSYLP
jgi:hypothetical protein